MRMYIGLCTLSIAVFLHQLSCAVNDYGSGSWTPSAQWHAK